MNELDRRALIQFIAAVEAHLLRILRQFVEFPLVAGRLDALSLRAAWDEVRPKFAELIRAIESREYDARLLQAGLSGAQLAFKLAIFEMASQAFRQEAEGRWSGMTGQWISIRIKKLLVKLLAAINLLMGSIAHAIHVAEPIKEFKEGLEQLLDLEEPEP